MVLALVGCGAGAVALAVRPSDTQFLYAQQAAAPVNAAQLDQILATAQDPRPGHPRERATAVRCTSSVRGGGLGNPWSCTVRYPTAPAVAYLVTITADGHVSGATRDGSLAVSGCCVLVG